MTSAPFSPPPPSAASTPTARRPTSCTRGIFCHAPGVQPSAFPPPAPPTPPVPWSAWWQPGGVWRRTGKPLEMGAHCAADLPRTSAGCRGNSASPASLSPTTLRRPSWWRTGSSGWRLTEAEPQAERRIFLYCRNNVFVPKRESFWTVRRMFLGCRNNVFVPKGECFWAVGKISFSLWHCWGQGLW